jgi:hypothetical protein
MHNCSIQSTYISSKLAQYIKACFPADTDGNTCGVDYPGYNFLYFAKPTEIVIKYLFREIEYVSLHVHLRPVANFNVKKPVLLDVLLDLD